MTSQRRYTPDELTDLRESQESRRIGERLYHLGDLMGAESKANEEGSTNADPYITDEMKQQLQALGVKPSTVRHTLSNIIACPQQTWSPLRKEDFRECLGYICRVPIASLARDSEAQVLKTHLGNFSVKFRYVIPIELCETHMVVVVLGTSSGQGGARLHYGKKYSCMGLAYEDDNEYVNHFGNLPLELPRYGAYPLASGAWTDVQFVVSVDYDDRIKKVEELPERTKDHLFNMVDYFRALTLEASHPRFVDPDALKRAQEWFGSQSRRACDREGERRARADARAQQGAARSYLDLDAPLKRGHDEIDYGGYETKRTKWDEG
jgi:hypothetical protein